KNQDGVGWVRWVIPAIRGLANWIAAEHPVRLRGRVVLLWCVVSPGNCLLPIGCLYCVGQQRRVVAAMFPGRMPLERTRHNGAAALLIGLVDKKRMELYQPRHRRKHEQ